MSAQRALACLAALLLAAGCGLIPVAPFERPPAPEPDPVEPAPAAADSEASAPREPEPAAPAAAEPPDLPAPGDVVAAAPAPVPEPNSEAAGTPGTERELPAAEAPGEGAGERIDPVLLEVSAILEEFYAAYNGREWKRARGLFWSGATITDVRILAESPTPAVKVASVAEFFEELARAREASPAGFEGRLEGAPLVRTASNVAQAWCQFEARFGGPQETMSWRRVDAFTFVLHEGQWKIAALAQSNNFDTQ